MNPEHLVEILNNTDLKYVKGTLMDDKGYFCAMGVLAKELLDDGELLPTLLNRPFLTPAYYDELLVLLGADKHYKESFRCPLEGFSCGNMIYSLSMVMSHINDQHNKLYTHKENARLLQEVIQYYNIFTGERLFSNGDE